MLNFGLFRILGKNLKILKRKNLLLPALVENQNCLVSRRPGTDYTTKQLTLARAAVDCEVRTTLLYSRYSRNPITS